jgi:hypothetical protein
LEALVVKSIYCLERVTSTSRGCSDSIVLGRFCIGKRAKQKLPKSESEEKDHFKTDVDCSRVVV